MTWYLIRPRRLGGRALLQVILTYAENPRRLLRARIGPRRHVYLLEADSFDVSDVDILLKAKRLEIDTTLWEELRLEEHEDEWGYRYLRLVKDGKTVVEVFRGRPHAYVLRNGEWIPCDEALEG